MTASAQFSTAGTLKHDGRPAAGDLGWDAALGLAESAAVGAMPALVVDFNDGRIDIRPSGSRRPETPSRQTTGHTAGRATWFGLRRPPGPPLRFNAETFVPALLTFLEGSCRIGVTGHAAAEIEQVRQRLAGHAPWHDYVLVDPDSRVPAALDLLVVIDMPAARHPAHPPAPAAARLTVMADDGLLSETRR